MDKFASNLVSTFILFILCYGGLSQLHPLGGIIFWGFIAIGNAFYTYKLAVKNKKWLSFIYSIVAVAFALYVIGTTVYSKILLNKYLKDTAATIQSECCAKGECPDSLNGWDKEFETVFVKTLATPFYKYRIHYHVAPTKRDDFYLSVHFGLDSYGPSIDGGLSQCKEKKAKNKVD